MKELESIEQRIDSRMKELELKDRKLEGEQMARFKRGGTQMSSKGAWFSTLQNASDYSNTQYWIRAEKYI